MNIIVPITDQFKDKYTDLLLQTENFEGIKVYVGIEEQNYQYIIDLVSIPNIQIIKFENGSKMEGMINSLHNYARADSIIVLRKPISIDELTAFINCRNEVATCSVERTKVKGFIFNIWQIILKFFLGIKEFEGDTSVVYLNEDMSAVVAESGNLSFATRANRLRGIEQKTIKVKDCKIKHETDKKSNIKLSLIASISFLFATILTIVLCLTIKITVIIGLLIMCLDLMCFSISFIFAIILIFNNRVGSKKVEEAVEIKENK